MLEPTLAELARSAVAVASVASLATVDIDGRPIVAPVPIVDDGSGQPITVLSNLTTHTERARLDSRAAMSVAGRLLLQGHLEPVPGLQQLELQPRFVAHHPTLTQQVESLDFSWFRLSVERVRWTDLADDEHWLRPEDLFGAEPDPLADLTSQDIADVAERLGEDMLLMMRTLGGRWLARSAALDALDRYGIVAMVDEPGRRSRTRVPFPERLDAAGEMHAALAALVQAAHSTPIGRGEADGGDSEDPEKALAERRKEALRLKESAFLASTPPDLGFSPVGSTSLEPLAEEQADTQFDHRDNESSVEA